MGKGRKCLWVGVFVVQKATAETVKYKICIISITYRSRINSKILTGGGRQQAMGCCCLADEPMMLLVLLNTNRRSGLRIKCDILVSLWLVMQKNNPSVNDFTDIPVLVVEQALPGTPTRYCMKYP